MAAVNWNQPSTGFVSDPAPSLDLGNDKAVALRATSLGIALDAVSKNAEALRARTQKTVAANMRSDESIGSTSFGPNATGSIGVNESAGIAAAGLNLVDSKNPLASLDGIGVAGISNRMAATGVVGATLGIRSTGVLGEALKGGVGVRGSGAQGGVQGFSTEGHGVAGSTQSATASGVFGSAPGVAGAGVSGQSVGGAGVAGRSSAGPGVFGASDQAQGVVGESAGANAAGVFGRNDLGNGIGVDGYSKAGIAVRAIAGNGVALHAEASAGVGMDVSNLSTSQPALKAYSLGKAAVDAMSLVETAVRAASTRAGVAGVSLGAPKAGDQEAGCGVIGSSIAGAGSCGATFSGTGVLGIGNPKLGAWAGRFQGNVHVDGILYKSASLFSIDHPLDPKRKVLNHACVEAPEYKTFYDGTATLNRRGQATVKLPRWFDALNHELRYQLTAIASPAPDLHVAGEPNAGSFIIAGGRPGQKVCWQVTGVRRDAWAKANPMRVEQPRASARSNAPVPSKSDLARLAVDLRKAAQAMNAESKARRKAAAKAPARMRRAPPIAAAETIREGASARSVVELLREVERLVQKAD